VINPTDLDDWRFDADSYGLSSVYDLNLDGLTNAADRSIIEQNLGLNCQTTGAIGTPTRRALRAPSRAAGRAADPSRPALR
jgi:hypothetical protein